MHPVPITEIVNSLHPTTLKSYDLITAKKELSCFMKKKKKKTRKMGSMQLKSTDKCYHT